MLMPVRCFSCGKVLSHLWHPYQEKMKGGEDSKKTLDSMGVERFCCRSLFLSNVDLVKEVGGFDKRSD